ncbi:MAG: hypothetical protein GY859_31430, partial [Desulfobacterales bacterium]|nr:hypothetical protein [Desulfobacterales bacterium]
MIGKILYQETEYWGKRSAGVADRNDRQVIWYEYGDDNSLQAARDLTGRRVEYHRNDRNL